MRGVLKGLAARPAIQAKGSGVQGENVWRHRIWEPGVILKASVRSAEAKRSKRCPVTGN